jgi:uncharacterized protein involved in exopolysaccharide biosynthesis
MEVQMTSPQVAPSDEIDLRELFSAIWQGKWLIIAVTSIFTVASVFYALSLPDVYKSEVTLAPAEDSSLKVPGQLGGLAALAGVNLGGKGGDKTALALEILKSRDFLGRFIEQNDLYIPIMAAKGWDRATNQLIIDPKIYDTKTNSWVREVEEPFKPKPSLLETIEEFRKNINISQEKTTNMVNLSVEHYSPYLGKEIAEKLVIKINENLRKRDLNEAEKSIEYLNKKTKETNIADVRVMLYSLIEEQTKTIMLANVRKEYVLKTIDPAVVNEEKSKPKRAVVVALISIFGFILTLLIVLVKHFKSK